MYRGGERSTSTRKETGWSMTGKEGGPNPAPRGETTVTGDEWEQHQPLCSTLMSGVIFQHVLPQKCRNQAQTFVLPLRKQQGCFCVGGGLARYVGRSRGLTGLVCPHFSLVGQAENEELNPTGQRAEILLAPATTSGSSGCLTPVKAGRNGPKVPCRSLTPS